MALFKNNGGTGGARNNGSTKSNPYPTTPVPLSRTQLAEIGDWRADANSAFGTAMAQQRLGTAQANRDYRTGRNQTRDQFNAALQVAGGRLQGTGMAWSPAAMGKLQLDLLNVKSSQETALAAERADRFAALQAIVDQAAQRKQAVRARAGRYTGTAGSELSRLLKAAS